MSTIEGYLAVFPASCACYGEHDTVGVGRSGLFTRDLLGKGVKGLGKITVPAHTACNDTQNCRELTAHVESPGVDAAVPNTDFIICHIPQPAGEDILHAP